MREMLVVRLLLLHQLEAPYFRCFDTKKAAAFPRNSLSILNSAFSRRSQSSPLRSLMLNSKAVSSPSFPVRSRPFFTHRPSSVADRFNSLATSCRYSEAYFFPVSMTVDILPDRPVAHPHQVSTTRGRPQSRVSIASWVIVLPSRTGAKSAGFLRLCKEKAIRPFPLPQTFKNH